MAAALLLAPAAPAPAATLVDRATNLVVFIGDGMGLEHVAAARAYKGAPLCFEDFPEFAVVDTASASGVTDSAAAATALATGTRVSNGVVSLAIPGDSGELRTVLEYFRDKGKRTGLVTTDVMTGATPAAFGAHVATRYDSAGITNDYLAQTRPNVLYGGGGIDAAAAAAAGYRFVTNAAELAALDPETATNVCGRFAAGLMPYEIDGVGAAPHLWEMASNALAVLDNEPAGFFLMVENGGIDLASHANDAPRMVREVLAFDAAVQAARDWATNRTDVLILVTADHETCGLLVTADNGPGEDPDVEWTAGWHTDVPVGCWAWGAGADYFAGDMANTNVHRAVVASALFQPWCAAAVDTPTNLTLTWQAASGDVFRVEYSEGLEAPDWQPLGVATAVSDTFTIIDESVVAATNRAYRAVALP